MAGSRAPCPRLRRHPGHLHRSGSAAVPLLHRCRALAGTRPRGRAAGDPWVLEAAGPAAIAPCRSVVPGSPSSLPDGPLPLLLPRKR